jgi:phosphopantetheinyl transferase
MRRAWSMACCLARLHDMERAEYETLRDANRRECWLLGRVLAKHIIRRRVAAGRDGPGQLDPRHILIVSRDAFGRRIRPRVFVGGQLQGWCLSIAYSDDSIAVALSDSERLNVGVDLVRRQPLGRGFRELWFSNRERAWTDAADGPAVDRAATIWAIKEAFYKAANTGDRFAPARIEVSCDDGGAYRLRLDEEALPDACRARTAISVHEISAVVTVETSRGSVAI